MADRPEPVFLALLTVITSLIPSVAFGMDLRSGLSPGFRNPTEVRREYEQAARGGNIEAMVALGRFHEEGQGGRIDYGLAFRTYRQAALLGRGHAEAEYSLAELYFRGRGVARDLGEALRWFREAANHGHPAAQVRVGAFHAEGWGVPVNRPEAYVWYTRALSQGKEALHRYGPNLDAARALATLRKTMTADEIGQAEKILAAQKR
ncbi:MAG: tetratricopeptide repeat protein [Alphaproteobacteria bacterium]